jgi:predicted transcriptional regulator
MLDEEVMHFPIKGELIKRIRKLMKDYGITQEDLAYNTKIPQAKISKIIGKNITQPQDLKYEDAQKMYNAILKLMSPFENKSITEIATKADEVYRNKGIIEIDQKLSVVAQKMAKEGFTQLIIEDKGGDYVGIITDAMLLNHMLHPREKISNWLKILGEQTIKESGLYDKVIPYSEESTQAEIAQALIHRYGVAISEGKGKFGIVTRNDFMKLLI